MEAWPRSSGDDVGVFSGGDEQGDVGVAQVVWPHRFSDESWTAGTRCAAGQCEPSGPPLGCGEDEVVLTRVGRQVCGEFFGEEWGEADGAAGGRCLEWFLDTELAAEQVEPIDAEGGQLAGAEAGVGAGQDEGPVSGPDRCGELLDLLDGGSVSRDCSMRGGRCGDMVIGRDGRLRRPGRGRAGAMCRRGGWWRGSSRRRRGRRPRLGCGLVRWRRGRSVRRWGG